MASAGQSPCPPPPLVRSMFRSRKGSHACLGEGNARNIILNVSQPVALHASVAPSPPPMGEPDSTELAD